MNKQQFKERFEKNVAYLKRNVPPDDIYMFTEQTFMAAMFFINKWAEWVDINEEAKRDPIAERWLKNIIDFETMKMEGVDIHLDLDVEQMEE